MLEDGGRRTEDGYRTSEVGRWLPRAIQVKIDVVQRDPFEQGERAKLNLGHTFGHALEKLLNFEMRHGDAVAIGMMCAAHLAVRLNMCRGQFATRLKTLLNAVGLPTQVPDALTTEAILDAMMTDKKRANERLRFILPHALGDVAIVDDVGRDHVMTAIDDTRSGVIGWD
jgi:3-dehydroquinate synthetase